MPAKRSRMYPATKSAGKNEAPNGNLYLLPFSGRGYCGWSRGSRDHWSVILMNKKLLKVLEAGFDLSKLIRGSILVLCSQCQALCVNGTPTHEMGCPNRRHECRGCNELISINERYCSECA